MDTDTQAQRLCEATAHAERLREQATCIARTIAQTERRAATVLDDAAAAHPERAQRLQAMAAHARAFAAHEEREAAREPRPLD